MKDISKDIVAKIKEGHIVPESKFRVKLRSYLFWALMCVMIFFGALSLSLVIFNVADIDPRFVQYLGLQKFAFLVFVTAPYLWILILLWTLLFGFLAFRKTSRGYRKSALFVTSLIVLAISVLGIFSHVLQIDRRMGGALSKNAPNFRGITGPREGRWLRPGDGLIGGDITSVGAGEFTLRGFDNQDWKISYDNKTEISGLKEISVGKKIGVIGKKTGELEMHAFSMRSFPDDWNGERPPAGIKGGGQLPPPPMMRGDFPDQGAPAAK